MKKGFIALGRQDKPQKMFYDPKQRTNNKTLADRPKRVNSMKNLKVAD